MTHISFPHLDEAMHKYGDIVVKAYQAKLEELGKPTTENTLAGTVRAIVRSNDRCFELWLELEHYWKYVEHGRPPGGKFPPSSAIERWIHIKPIVPYPQPNGKLPSVRQLTFLIQRKIAEEGIAPTNALADSVASTKPTWEKMFQEALEADLNGKVEEWVTHWAL